jgi:hypothetical protein
LQSVADYGLDGAGTGSGNGTAVSGTVDAGADDAGASGTGAALNWYVCSPLAGISVVGWRVVRSGVGGSADGAGGTRFGTAVGDAFEPVAAVLDRVEAVPAFTDAAGCGSLAGVLAVPAGVDGPGLWIEAVPVSPLGPPVVLAGGPAMIGEAPGWGSLAGEPPVPPEAVAVAVPPEPAAGAGAGVPDKVVVGFAAAISSLGCNCSGVGRVISVSGEPACLPAAEIVTVTEIGVGAAFGFAKSTD